MEELKEDVARQMEEARNTLSVKVDAVIPVFLLKVRRSG
jgi:hypothetical protein